MFGRVTIPGELAMLMILCGALGIWHLYCCWKGSIVGLPKARANFAPVGVPQHTTLVFVGSLIIGAIGVTVAFSAGMFTTQVLDQTAYWTVLLFATAMCLCGLLACLFNCRLSPVRGGRASSLSVGQWRQWAPLWWIPTLALLAALRYFLVTSHLTLGERVPTIWRSIRFRSGVSGLVPQVLLLLGMYVWFWLTLRALSLFGDDRPRLPEGEDPGEAGGEGGPAERTARGLGTLMSRGWGAKIERVTLPLGSAYVLWLGSLVVGVCIVAGIVLGSASLRTLGDRAFGRFIFALMCVAIALILADALQLLRTWASLRELLIHLDRLRLRRAVEKLTGLAWPSISRMSANVREERGRLLSRQFESADHLRNCLMDWKPDGERRGRMKDSVLEALGKLQEARGKFCAWQARVVEGTVDVGPAESLQELLAETATKVVHRLLLQAWSAERAASPLSGEEKREVRPEMVPGEAALVRTAEEFVALCHLGFIQSVLGRCRTLALGIATLFFSTTLAISSYPFDPLPAIGALFVAVFVIVGTTLVFVYAGMNRDPILSCLTQTKPGALGLEFWLRIVTFGLGPLIGLLTALFPSLTETIVSFLQPGTQIMK